MDIVRLSPRLTLVRADLPSDPDAAAREIRLQMRDAGGLSGHYGAAEPRDWRIVNPPVRERFRIPSPDTLEFGGRWGARPADPPARPSWWRRLLNLLGV